MITFPPNPIPVCTPLGDGYILYVKENGHLENDEVTVTLLDGGIVKHFTTAHIKIYHNETYEIRKKNEKA